MPAQTGSGAPEVRTLPAGSYVPLQAGRRRAARYAKLKHQLAPLLRTDRTAYVTGKAGLIVELLTQARQRNS